MFNSKEKKGKVNINGERISYVRKTHVFASRGKLIAAFIALFLVVFAAGMAWRFHTMLSATPEEISDKIASTLGEASPEYKALKEQGHFNMLVVGEDDVEGSKRSDTILFVTVELDDKCIKVLSLPRDTYVAIPGHGHHKLNSSFAYGGVELLKTTVENYLGEPILYYVIVDYENFPKLVDAFGGVEIDVKKKMRYVDRAGHLDINIQPGIQQMDGTTALHYVRFRKDALGDIGRVQRQQQFIKALLKRAYSPSIIVKLPAIIAETMNMFKTDMPINLAAVLAGFAKTELKREDIYMSTLFGQAEMIDNLSYWVGDPKAGKRFVNASLDELQTGNRELGETGIIAGYSKGYSSAAQDARNAGEKKAENSGLTREQQLELVKTITQPVAVLNGSGEKGISATVAQKLQELGVDVTYKGNAKHYDYMYTNIVYPPDANSEVVETAKKLGQLLSVPKNLIRPNKQAFDASVIIGHDYKEVIKLLEAK